MTPTYLLTWNPARFAWHDLNREAAAVARGTKLKSRWSCGNTTSIEKGSRIFMLRQGVPPRGIVASGWVTGRSYRDLHWDEERSRRGEEANYVDIRLDSLLDSSSEPFPVEDMPHAELRAVNWHTPASGIRLRPEAAARLELLWEQFRGGNADEDSDSDLTGVEGILRVSLIHHRSRERMLRAAKIRQALREGKLLCEVPGCGFDFEARYGSLGTGFAHVHHILPVAAMDGPTPVQLEDLSIVCANCHAMIHRGGECRPLAGLIPGV
jgi:5-methylcytosine-specific restriction enzyme A